MSKAKQESSAGDVRLIAFYLTQFHPVPENDEWWGKGFTEWTNVTKAKPLFDGHYQPKLPSETGFYDLRVRETRHQQIELAKEYGIDAFCYHYYWFSGKRLLERPLEDMLADPQSDMPFCLCWANENWTRRWDAAEHEVLIAQQYRPEDDLEFAASLLPYFNDARYVRLDGKPLLIVYRPQHLPDARQSLERWRAFFVEKGVGEVHLCAALTHGNSDYQQYGFDSGVEFPPHNLDTENIAAEVPFAEPFRGYVGRYSDIANCYLQRSYAGQSVFRGVFPAWDNTPRTGDRGVIVLDSSPDNYEYWLSQSIEKTFEEYPDQERLVFINAWNEWAEGCYLEPDHQFHRQYLEATFRAGAGLSEKDAFSETAQRRSTADKSSLFVDLSRVFKRHAYIWAGEAAARLKQYPRLRRFVKTMLGR